MQKRQPNRKRTLMYSGYVDVPIASIYLSMMAFPKILEWADNDIDHVILRHDVNYKDTRVQEFHKGSVTRYNFC